MATATTPTPAAPSSLGVGEDRFLIGNLGWDGYETLLRLFDERGPRIYYLGGNVELMSIHPPHERFKKLLGFLIETIAEELEIPCDPLGSTTYRRKSADAGAEPDECYYIANAGALAGKDRVDLEIDPPPDLVIEVEISSPRLEKLELYARLGVPEIWRFDGATLSILILGPDQRYHGSENSLSFPFLRIDALTGWIDETQHLGEMDRRRAFRAWVHERLEPLFRERS